MCRFSLMNIFNIFMSKKINLLFEDPTLSVVDVAETLGFSCETDTY